MEIQRKRKKRKRNVISIKKQERLFVSEEIDEIVIYSLNDCEPCEKLEEKLKEKKIPFTRIDVREDEEAQKRIIEKEGVLVVPAIEINGKIEQVGI